MTESTKSLYPSLVGSSIEFSFKKKVANVTTIEKNIQVAKKRITSDIEEALSIGGELCVMLLAELTSFYSHEPYYMAVRSSIQMRRYRPLVLEYMQKSVSEREERLQRVLSEKLRKDNTRELKVSALRYFLMSFPRRITNFKKLLTREEYLLVA